MSSSTILDLSIDLTVELTAACDQVKGRTVYINQILRSCSSIGANASEAKYAQSRNDFIHKLEIALKECYETDYWLKILFKTNAITETQYKLFSTTCGTIRKKLIASITTAKNNHPQHPSTNNHKEKR